MTSVFAEVVNMSCMAIWLILAVIIVRLLCRKITKNLCYLLWALVGVRLLCPYTIESPWSMIPNQTSFERFVEIKNDLQKELGINQTEIEKNDYEDIRNEYEKWQDKLEQSADEFEKETGGLRPIEIVTIIWGAGVVLILAYTATSFYRLKRMVAVSVRKNDEVWVCDAIHSPFVLGVFKPRVYVPSEIEEEQITYILAHEKEHLKWHDNIWKLVGLFILAMHWFNPLVWLAYVLLCRDIELACDERVVKTMDEEEKRNYVKSLLICSSPTQFAGLGSVAFGEISIHKRIKGVLSYRKASFWRVFATIVICVAVVVGFMTNPKGQEFIAEVEKEIKEELKETKSDRLVIYETIADLNHDGIDDLVQVVRKAWGKEGIEKVDYYTNSFSIQVFVGEGDGEYSKNKVNLVPGSTTLWDIWIGRSYNGMYAITEYQGKEYLLYTRTCEIDGDARYIYDVIEVVNDNTASRVEHANQTFACDPYWSQWDAQKHREDIVPQFREQITPWLENAKMIICSDENGVYIAEAGREKSAKAYFTQIWKRSDEVELAEYETLKGTERWEKIIYKDSENAERYISWIKALMQSDFSKWYEDYNGESLQRIDNHEDGSKNCSLSKCCDVIYYKNGYLQDSLIKMFWKMVDGKYENRLNCTYDIYAFGYPEQPVVQITENMWLIRYFNGYYGYQGVDGITFDERVASITNYYEVDNGAIALLRDEEASEYWFILLKKDGVYRLERMENMMQR